MVRYRSMVHRAKEQPVDSDTGRQVGTPKRHTVKEEPRQARIRVGLQQA